MELLQQPGILKEEEVRFSIPSTIRHAMGLTKMLGEEYFWVDRFCICQDDIEVKHSQLQSMADIYGNAYLTIVAANEWDANHGLRGLKGVTKPRGVSQYLTTRQYSELMDLNNTIWRLDFPGRFILQAEVIIPVPDEDGLRAYLGVIKQFSTAFPAGFFWGLPVSEFHAALLWQPKDTLTRRRARGNGTDSLELPSWSWVGWQGGIDTTVSMDESQMLRPLLNNERPEGNTQAMIHDSRFLYTQAPVARAWFGDQVGSNMVDAPVELVALALMALGPEHEASLQRVWICSSPDLKTGKAVCGALNLSPGLRPHAGEKCELLAISTAKYKYGLVKDLQFNYLLWIGREDDVAYRKGLSVVLVDDWETLDPRVEAIVLG
ncbi:heterokaryon incompatibility protein-domain-containing protein [Apiospora saccharicola]